MNNLAKHGKTIVSKGFSLCVHFLLSNVFFLPPTECHFKTLWLALWFAQCWSLEKHGEVFKIYEKSKY